MSVSTYSVASLSIALMLLAGCGGGGPSLNKVTGTVTMDGKPLPGATVTLKPVAGGTGRPATGLADENGVYTVTDMESENIGGGAVAGDYLVSIMWYKPSKDTSQSTGVVDGAEAMSNARAAQPVQGPDSLLPVAYQDPDTSGLTITVAEGDNPPFDFELDSKFEGAK